jgi:UDP-N-acetyl-2-amino-2-deoxyglucuronate dehydrogenase
MPKTHFNFAIIGVAGYVAPRHLKAIKETGNKLVAAVDPHDSVGILDKYGFGIKYFREIERFDRFMDRLRRDRRDDKIDFVSICSPNYLHDAHIRLSLRNEANVICEKPITINPWNLDYLKLLEEETKKRVYTVLQLRVHPDLMGLKQRLEKNKKKRYEVEMTYITSRGEWYHNSWKGKEEYSGGLALNIGVHLFDLLIWLFGKVEKNEVHLRESRKVAGATILKNADVKWFLSIDNSDLPNNVVKEQRTTYRNITVEGQKIEFSEGFTDLHTILYDKTLKGEGFGIEEARSSIELVYKIRTDEIKKSLPKHSYYFKAPKYER